jgi:organic radical activating enzyme
MPSDWVVFTGGEPTTVLTEPLTSFMAAFYELQMETNGTHICPTLLDYMSHVSISPKKFSMELSHWQGWYDYILQRIAPPSASKLTVDFRFSVEIDELVDVDLMGAQSHAHAITWCQPLDYSLLKALRTLGVNMWMSPIWHSRTAPRPDQIEKCVHLLGTPLARDVGLRLNTQIHKYLDIR